MYVMVMITYAPSRIKFCMKTADIFARLETLRGVTFLGVGIRLYIAQTVVDDTQILYIYYDTQRNTL